MLYYIVQNIFKVVSQVEILYSYIKLNVFHDCQCQINLWLMTKSSRLINYNFRIKLISTKGYNYKFVQEYLNVYTLYQDKF